MPVYAPNVAAASISISVDKLKNIVLATRASPSCASSACARKTVIRRIQNPTGPYQRLRMSLTAYTVLGGPVFELDAQQDVKLSFKGTGAQATKLLSNVKCVKDETSKATTCPVRLT